MLPEDELLVGQRDAAINGLLTLTAALDLTNGLLRAKVV